MRDGMGVERLRELGGVRVGIVTKETSAIVAARAAKLGIEDLYSGITDKRQVAEDAARRHGIALSNVAFIGDDVNDLDLLRAAGLSACPSDAEPAVLRVVDYVCSHSGGHGAFRELAEIVVAAQATAHARRQLLSIARTGSTRSPSAGLTALATPLSLEDRS
jgi:YrbI family 3-deoxy-D-manno-octulosonate 8-phosphate phosphatase